LFLQVFQMYVSSVSFVSFCMLQLLHLNVSKVDRVLRMECAWEAGGGASSPHMGNVQAAWAPTWARVTQAWSSEVGATMRAHAWTHETERKSTVAAGVRMSGR
jgi:hypothetical protein